MIVRSLSTMHGLLLASGPPHAVAGEFLVMDQEVAALASLPLRARHDERSASTKKGADLAELAGAIRAVAAGKNYLSPAITTLVVDRYAGRGSAEVDETVTLLSPREEEVLQLLAEGRTSKEIARELSISVRTVDGHRQKIMEKLSIYSVAGLVKWAIRHGLTTEDA